jgi:hypothetical protein
MEFLLSCLISIFIAILLSWLTIRFADWNFERRNLVKNKLINITFNFKPITEALEAVSLIFSNPELIKELIEARQEFEKQERWQNDPLQIKERFLDPIVYIFLRRNLSNDRSKLLIHNGNVTYNRGIISLGFIRENLKTKGQVDDLER